MAVPRHKHTRSSVGQRRMHIYIKPAVLVNCQKCGRQIKPHIVCLYCGYYKGRQVIDVLGKLTKKERKVKEKEMKEAQKEQKSEKPISMEELSKK